MKLEINLSTKSLNRAIGELKRYRDSLQPKTELFLSRLIDEGIKVANSYRGFYGSYIVFDKTLKSGKHQCVGILTGKNTKLVSSYWDRYGKVVHSEISPILFAEFGSGWLSEVLFDDAPLNEVGQGTFPDQKHAFDPKGWWYKTQDGEWHHSRGFKPSHPMYHADMAMLEQIYSIAREVFYSG